MSTCQRLVTRKRDKPCHNVTSAPLCFDCIKLAGTVVKSLKEYADELEIQITRQDRGAPSVGGGSGEPRLAFDVDSSQARDDLEKVLSHWFAENTDGAVHRQVQGLTASERLGTLLAWHRRFYVDLGRADDGPQYLAELDDILAQVSHAVDRKSTKIWIGNCDCGKAVMAFPNQKADVVCECGLEWSPQQSRRDLRVLGGGEVVTIAQARRLGEVWGRKINPSTVRSWLRREKIVCQGDCTEENHEHTFVMSHILALHKEN